MDFMTFVPYWGIIVLVIINGIWVHARKIEMQDNEES